MSNREIVLNFVAKLPEDASLHDIARRIEFIAGLKEAEEQADRGEGTPAEDARALIEKWARQ